MTLAFSGCLASVLFIVSNWQVRLDWALLYVSISHGVQNVILPLRWWQESLISKLENMKQTPSRFMMTSSNGNISVLAAFVRRIHRSPVNSPHKGQWLGALLFSLNCAWTNSWANNGDAGDLRCHCAHYDFILMLNSITWNSYATSVFHCKQWNSLLGSH